MLQVKKASVVALFVTLGLKTAATWTDKQLMEKIKGLSKVVDEDTDKVKDPNQLNTLKALLKATAKKEEIQLVDSTKAAPSKPTTGKAPKAKPVVAEEEEDDEETDDADADDEEGVDEDGDEDGTEDGETEEEEVEEEEVGDDEPDDGDEADSEDEDDESEESEDDDSGDESETEDEEEEAVAEKPKKKAPVKAEAPKEKPKGQAPPKRVGVISTIIACLGKASESKPASKESILKVLVAKFPDREERAMKSTVNSQVPSGLLTEKKITLERNDDGFWLSDADKEKWYPDGKKEAKPAAKASAPAAPVKKKVKK